MEKSLLRNLSNYVGGGLIAAAGLLFVLIGDTKATLPSTWLFGAILLAIGGAIFFLVADTQKDKHIVFYLLKIIGILLSIGFIAYLFIFKANDIASNVKAKTIIFLLPTILSFFAIIVQIFNIVFNIKNGTEE